MVVYCFHRSAGAENLNQMKKNYVIIRTFHVSFRQNQKKLKFGEKKFWRKNTFSIVNWKIYGMFHGKDNYFSSLSDIPKCDFLTSTFKHFDTVSLWIEFLTWFEHAFECYCVNVPPNEGLQKKNTFYGLSSHFGSKTYTFPPYWGVRKIIYFISVQIITASSPGICVKL